MVRHMDFRVTIGGGGGDLAAWAQAITSTLAVLVALYLPWAQRRKDDKRAALGRLAVKTETVRPGLYDDEGLNRLLIVSISYLPEDHRSGLVARITVLNPAGCGIVPRALVTADPRRSQEDGAFVGLAFTPERTVQTPLDVHLPSHPEHFGAVLYVSNPDTWDRKARLKVDVLTNTTYPVLLLSTKVDVSPLS